MKRRTLPQVLAVIHLDIVAETGNPFVFSYNTNQTFTRKAHLFGELDKFTYNYDLAWPDQLECVRQKC